jgi:8-oxo-dGTP diphosphatase
MPVALAVITSETGVLVIRRADGDPPWAFPGGKTEVGEPTVVAAAREVYEETGLWVLTSAEIGRRAHPDSGKDLVYVVGRTVSGTEPAPVAGPGILDVRWVSYGEALTLMPDMHKIPSAWLAETLGAI